MVKGVSVKFVSYAETIPKMLKVIKFPEILKKQSRIILKPNIQSESGKNTSPEFVEAVLKFCIENKAPETEIFVAEGPEQGDAIDLFENLGYKSLAEKYGIGLIDLNNAETEEMINDEFLKFDSIQYPQIMKDSFIVSLPVLRTDEESEIAGSLQNMLGAFPAKHYTGFFSTIKNKIRKWPIKYSIHDILKCRMPEFAIVDASEKGVILAGIPLEIDKQAAKLLGLDWKAISHLRLIDESFPMPVPKKEPSQS